MKFTENQLKARDIRDCGMLVSAGAGSGKTGVLVARLMSYITGCDEDGSRIVPDGAVLYNLDDFLVITYTKAAASELKFKVTEKLAKAAQNSSNPQRIFEQSSSIGRAKISTIHSFCSTVIKENSYILGISPNFKIIDSEKENNLKERALEKLLDSKYENMTPEFRRLVNTVGVGRDDSVLCELILTISEKIQSHPHPEKWVNQQIQINNPQNFTDVGKTPWGEYELGEVKRKALYWEKELLRLSSITAEYPKLYKNYGLKLPVIADQLRELSRCTDISWDMTKKAIEDIDVLRISVQKPENPELKDYIKSHWDICKNWINEIKQSNLTQSSEKLIKDIAETTECSNLLLKLALEFNDEYTLHKRRYSYLDYSDLEHFAVKVLVDENGSPTQQALDISNRFAEIMVDEYQDVSEIQETIFNAISNGGKKLFCVGDIKQSIYSFRLANPRFFKEKYNSYPTYSPDSANKDKVKILLSENFRSRKGVLDFANSFFVRCMSETLGEVEYNTDVTLKYGGVRGDTGLSAEMLLLDKSLADSFPFQINEKDIEAYTVAYKIKEIVASGFKVGSPDELRPIQYSDVAILLRNCKSKGGRYIRALNDLGIPVDGGAQPDYFSSHEISFMVSFLDVIANPFKDIPLIAVLRSPVFTFTADNLTDIRTASPGLDFYTALTNYRNDGEDAQLKDKCGYFLDLLYTMRSLAPDISASELIREIISRLNLTMIFGAMDEGTLRRRNLISFITLAEGFDEAGNRGLFPFVFYLKKIAGEGKTPSSVTSAKGVIISTIHSSKGLQYPVVFLCNTNDNFNNEDCKKRTLIHHELGIGSRVIDKERGIGYPTLSYNAVLNRLKRDQYSEEMRLLYVALTRAEDYLYITGTTTQKYMGECSTVAGSYGYSSNNVVNPDGTDYGCPIDPDIVMEKHNFLYWLLLASNNNPYVKVSINPTFFPEEAAGNKESTETSKGENTDIPEFVNTCNIITLPTKLTATELKGYREEDEESVKINAAAPDYKYNQPNFMSKDDKIDGAMKGTITHRFLQIVDLKRAKTLKELKEQLNEMTEKGIFTQAESEAVNLHSVYGFFQSDIGKRLIKSGNVRREFRFSLLVSPKDIGMFAPSAIPQSNNDKREIVFQGVIDCFFMEGDELVIIDYKTDYITNEETLKQKETLYQPQIESYTIALERITGIKVKESKLWFLGYNK